MAGFSTLIIRVLRRRNNAEIPLKDKDQPEFAKTIFVGPKGYRPREASLFFMYIFQSSWHVLSTDVMTMTKTHTRRQRQEQELIFKCPWSSTTATYYFHPRHLTTWMVYFSFIEDIETDYMLKFVLQTVFLLVKIFLVEKNLFSEGSIWLFCPLGRDPSNRAPIPLTFPATVFGKICKGPLFERFPSQWSSLPSTFYLMKSTIWHLMVGL